MDIAAQYDGWHGDLSVSNYRDGLRQPWHKTAASLLPDLTGKHVLELGCGRGAFSDWIAHNYQTADVLGVDFSETAIAMADMHKGRAAFLVGDAQSLELPSESFDLVVSCECLEHVPRPDQMAAEIYRVLKPGGRFILTTENYFNGMLLAWLRSWATDKPFNSGTGAQPHENFFLFWRVRRLLEHPGLRVTHMESNHYQWLLLPRVDPAKLMTEDVTSAWLKRLLLPFGRHFTFVGERPS